MAQPPAHAPVGCVCAPPSGEWRRGSPLRLSHTFQRCTLIHRDSNQSLLSLGAVFSGVCPILSRRAGGCVLRFSQVETYWLYPVFSPARPAPRNLSIRLYKRTRVTRMQNTAPWPLERFSCARMGQCKCCAENYSTRSRWPGSNRHRPQFCFRAALPLSYSDICAAGRKRQSPAAIGKEGRGMDNPASLLSS